MSESEHSAFLAAIIANPPDDLPRLVYADVLEESGDLNNVARAHFIRAQTELARPTANPDTDRIADLTNYVRSCIGRKHYGFVWCRTIHRWWGQWEPRSLSASRWFSTNKGWSCGRPELELKFRRGFVGGLRLAVSLWDNHASGLMGSAPIEYVQITDLVHPADQQEMREERPGIEFVFERTAEAVPANFARATFRRRN